MSDKRSAQLAYSDSQALMLDDESRRSKASKMAAVIQHFRGCSDLSGLRVVDIGCSGGIVADELHRRGADVIGIDIDRPGLSKAQARFGSNAHFVCADSELAPIASQSADVVVCNHVYEHVVDPDRLFAELRRIVKPNGTLYLGLGNRLGVVEPHYRLPFLSWLPRRVAHRYIRLMRRADRYHEEFRTRAQLIEMCADLHVWDYTLPILRSPRSFGADSDVPGWTHRLPRALTRVLRPLIPTYIWVASTSPSAPQGPHLESPPELVRSL